MNKNILLFDENLRFAQKFQTYFQGKDSSINVDIFDSIDYCRKVLGEKSYAVVLVNQNLYRAVSDLLEGSIVILLVSTDISEEYKEFFKLNKLMSLEAMYEEINDIYVRENKIITVSSDSSATKIISFFSPLGGCGKTNMSLITANILAEAGKKVLYIPMEDFNDKRFLFGASNIEMSMEYLFTGGDMLSAIRYNKSKFIAKNPETNLHYIVGLDNLSDYEAISSEDFIGFLKILKEETDYEYIVFDLMNFQTYIEKIWIESSDYVFAVASKGYMEGIIFEKGLRLFNKKYLENGIAERIYGIINSPKNSASTINFNTDIFSSYCELPYDTSIKTVINGELAFPMNSVVANRLRSFLYSVSLL